MSIRAVKVAYPFSNDKPLFSLTELFMTKNKLEYRKQIAVFKAEEYEALKDAAEEDFRPDADQLRYLAVQKLRERGLLEESKKKLKPTT